MKINPDWKENLISRWTGEMNGLDAEFRFTNCNGFIGEYEIYGYNEGALIAGYKGFYCMLNVRINTDFLYFF